MILPLITLAMVKGKSFSGTIVFHFFSVGNFGSIKTIFLFGAPLSVITNKEPLTSSTTDNSDLKSLTIVMNFSSFLFKSFISRELPYVPFVL